MITPRLRIIAVSLFAALALATCKPPLVNETYATLKYKSINGIDAFYAMLQGEERKVSVNSYLSRELLREADLIVHFEKKALPGPLRRAEAWLMGVKLKKEKKKKEDKKADQPDKDPGDNPDRRPRKSPRDPSDDVDTPQDALLRAHPPFLAQQDTQDGDSDKDKDKDQKGTKEKFPPRRKRVVMYFVRDTTSAVNFWSRVSSQMPPGSRERKFCDANLADREDLRSRKPGPGRILFGTRRIKYEQGIYARRFYYDKTVFPQGVQVFPVRGTARPAGVTDPELDYAKALLGARVLLSTVNGDFLIHELKLKNGILLLIYNSEPFLNFSMVRKPYRRTARRLIDYAARRARKFRPKKIPGESRFLPGILGGKTKKGERPLRIALIETSLARVEEVANESDDLIRRLLFTFPVNVILLHVLGILILFLIARWPHEKAPVKLPEVGERAYIEHIHALGEKMAVSKNPGPAVEALARYLKMSMPSMPEAPPDGDSDRAEQGILANIARLWQGKRK